MVLIFFGVALLSAPLIPGPDGHPRLAGDAARRSRRRARAGQRAAQPAAHRLDRGGADDRPRARHARRDARRRHHAVVHGAPSTTSSTGDYAITAQNNFSPIPIAAAEAAAKAPGVTCGRQRPHRRDARLRQDRFSTAVDPGASEVINARLDRGLARRSSARSATTARSSTRTTRRSTTCRSARRSTSPSSNGKTRTFVDQGHLRPAAGRLAVRRRHDLGRDVGRGEPDAAEHLLVRADGRRRDGRERRRARGRP